MAITDRSSLGRDLVPWAHEMGALALPAIQLREKDLSDRELFELAVEIRRVLPPTTVLLVNGRADIARAAGAQGVHLPANEISTRRLRKSYPPPFLIGRSTHHLGEIRREIEQGADYVTFGPVFPTPSKEPFGPPRGLDRLQEAARLELPVLALGGIQEDRLEEVARAGAAGAAGIRLFFREPVVGHLLPVALSLFRSRHIL